MHLEDYIGQKPKEILPIDGWIIDKMKKVEDTVIFHLKAYDIGSARQEIDEFFWDDFCDNYIEIVKDRLYKPQLHGKEERISAQYALYKVLLEILKIYAIYVPYITEEIYQEYYRTFECYQSIHVMEWNMKEENIDGNLLTFGENIKNVMKEVRKYKSERGISLKEPLRGIKIMVPQDEYFFIDKTSKDLKACIGTQGLEISLSHMWNVEILS